ncbi:MAG: SIMPL domain-containing protein [Nanoarchaeota archaeon]
MDTKMILGFLLVGAVMLSACAPQQITVSPQPERNTLSVSGEGQLEVNPDKASITLAFVTNATTAKEAQDKNRAMSNAVVDALKGAGVKNEEIETIYYDLHQLWGWNQKTGERFDQGYELEHRMKITTTNLESVGNIIDLSIRSGANRVDSIEFGLTKPMERQAKGEALAKAAQEAAAKAQSIAANVGVNIGKVMRVSESAYYNPVVPSYRKEMMAAAAYDSAGAAPTPIGPQKLTVTATVSLDYEIR